MAALLACGELCRGCGQTCVDMPSESNVIEIESSEDRSQFWKLTECPKRFTRDIVDAVNAAQLADSHLPVAGGTLDQSAWWIALWQTFRQSVNRIESESIEREQRRVRR